MSVTRYVVTYIGKNGLRTLVGPAQGRNTRATREEAEQDLVALRGHNSRERLTEFFGNPDLMEVRPVECYDGHHDPMGIYFD
jgi:hypothetical protein